MFVLAIYNCAKATLTSREVWRYGNSRSPEPAKGPALSLASAALPAAGSRALAAVGQAVSSRALSLYPGCTSCRIPSGAARASRSGAAV